MSLKERVPNIRPMGQTQHAKKVLFCQTEGLCKVKETAKNPLAIPKKRKCTEISDVVAIKHRNGNAWTGGRVSRSQVV